MHEDYKQYERWILKYLQYGEPAVGKTMMLAAMYGAGKPKQQGLLHEYTVHHADSDIFIDFGVWVAVCHCGWTSKRYCADVEGRRRVESESNMHVRQEGSK